MQGEERCALLCNKEVGSGGVKLAGSAAQNRHGGLPGREPAASAGLGSLPLLVYDVVAAVYGEDVGLVDVVLGVGVVGADAQLLFGGQVVDGD